MENNGKSHPSSSSNSKHLFSVYKELKQDLLFLEWHSAAGLVRKADFFLLVFSLMRTEYLGLD